MGSKFPLPINGQRPGQSANERPKRISVGVITNPNARASVRAHAEVSGSHHVLREEVTASPTAVPDAIDRLLAYDCDTIVVNGGDGTLGSVIGHLEKRKSPLPRLIPVLGGTNNSVAKDVGAVGRIAAVKQRISEHASLADLPIIKRATIYVDREFTPPGTTERQTERLGCGFVFSTGLITRFADAYYAGPMSGPVQAAKVVIEKLSTAMLPTAKNRAFWAFEPNRIAIDGEPITLPRGAALSYMSTIDTQILFFRPFLATASELVEKHAFNVLVSALPKTTILRHFFALVLGRYRGDGHALAASQKLTISGTRRVMLDGEMWDVGENEQLTLTPGPIVEFIAL